MRWNWTKTFLIQTLAFGVVGGLIGWATGNPEKGLGIAVWFLLLAVPGGMIADVISWWRARGRA